VDEVVRLRLVERIAAELTRLGLSPTARGGVTVRRSGLLVSVGTARSLYCLGDAREILEVLLGIERATARSATLGRVRRRLRAIEADSSLLLENASRLAKSVAAERL
jgi:hypothetical protein